MPSSKHNFIERLARMRRALCNDRGNLSLMFAFSVLPICLSAGMAIDYTRAANVKTRLQHAVDAAALAAGSMSGAPEAEVIETAEKIFHANFELPSGSSGASVTITVEPAKITVAGQTSVGTTMLKLASMDELAVQASAEATPPQVANGEIVLVLDYSWSMTDSAAGGGGVKWQTMRDAAKQLVATLGQNGANPNVKFGLAPFSEWVRLSMPKQYVLGQSGSGTWTGCTKDRKYPYNMQDTTPTSSNSTKFRQCGWRSSGGTYNCVQATTSQCNQYANNDIVVMELFDLDDADTVNRLEGCATSSENFFDANSGDALSNAFLQITGQLASKLYLSK